jgi:hypothetical protein
VKAVVPATESFLAEMESKPSAAMVSWSRLVQSPIVRSATYNLSLILIWWVVDVHHYRCPTYPLYMTTLLPLATLVVITLATLLCSGHVGDVPAVAILLPMVLNMLRYTLSTVLNIYNKKLLGREHGITGRGAFPGVFAPSTHAVQGAVHGAGKHG